MRAILMNVTLVKVAKTKEQGLPKEVIIAFSKMTKIANRSIVI